MPGVNMAVSFANNLKDKMTKIERLQDTMKHDLSYYSSVLLSNDKCFLGFTGYKNYPFTVFEAGNNTIILEGFVYNKELHQVQNSLKELALQIATGQDIESRVRNWVLNADGDYLVIILNQALNKLFLFNDPMGRLPVYACQLPNMFALSREVKFLAGISPDFRYDKIGIAETLIFGYTLGANTLIENVSRLEGGILLSIDYISNSVKYERTYAFNIDELFDQPPKPIKVYTHDLVDRFLSACYNIKQTFSDYNLVVSLSGGFDSRSVLTGMKNVKAPVAAFTFQDQSTATRGTDARYAEQLASMLGVGWRLYEMPSICIKDIEELLWIKDGMNFSQMAFLLPLFKRIKADYGLKVLHMTGDNGDRSMDPQGAPINLKSLNDFLNFTIERNSRIKLKDVAAITRLNENEIIEQIRQKLSQYPERNPNNQYRHFILAERLFNWNFQAEDRNRTFFWHATPFSSFPYFSYAMSIPDRIKKHWKLYLHFLNAISPLTTEVFYANWEAPITSYKRYWYPFKQSIYGRLPAWSRILIRDRTLYRGLNVNENLTSYLSQQINLIDSKGRLLNNKALLDVAGHCNVNEFHNMLTIVTYIRLNSEKMRLIHNS